MLARKTSCISIFKRLLGLRVCRACICFCLCLYLLFSFFFFEVILGRSYFLVDIPFVCLFIFSGLHLRVDLQTVDQFFELRLPVDITHLQALLSIIFHTLDAYLQKVVNQLGNVILEIQSLLYIFVLFCFKL